MAEIILKLWVIGFKGTFALATGLSFLVLGGTLLSLLITSINHSILGDLMAILQLWMPFNLYIFFTWIITISMLYLGYRISSWIYNWVEKWLNS